MSKDFHKSFNPSAAARFAIKVFPANVPDFSSRSKVDLLSATDPQACFHRWVLLFTTTHCLNVDAAASMFPEGWELMCELIFGDLLENVRAELTDKVMFEIGAFGQAFFDADGFTAVQVSPIGRVSRPGGLWRKHLSTKFILSTMLHEACHALLMDISCRCKKCEDDDIRYGGHVNGWAILARAVEERARRVLGVFVDLEVDLEMSRR